MITTCRKNRKSRRLHYLSNLLLTSILPQVPEIGLSVFPFPVQSRGKVPFSTNPYVVHKVSRKILKYPSNSHYKTPVSTSTSPSKPTTTKSYPPNKKSQSKSPRHQMSFGHLRHKPIIFREEKKKKRISRLYKKKRRYRRKVKKKKNLQDKSQKPDDTTSKSPTTHTFFHLLHLHLLHNPHSASKSSRTLSSYILRNRVDFPL